MGRADDNKSRKKEATWPEQVMGAKYVRLLEKQLETLRAEDAHGNRKLFLDDVFVMYLLAFFNPIVRSLRTVEDLSQTPQAQRHLSVQRVCKSTLSDFNKLADPTRLEPILSALRTQISRKSLHHSSGANDLNSLLSRTIAVDGTFLPAVAEVSWAVANSNNHGAVRHRARLDVHVNVSTWLPEIFVVPETGQSEADSASQQIQPGAIYVYDRGFMSFDLIRAHYRVENTPQSADAADAEVRSHFVIRYKKEGGNSPTLQNAADQELTDEDRAAGVLSDRTGYFNSGHAKRASISEIRLREVMIRYEEEGQPKQLRLITNLMNVSARTIGLLYRFRWQVELFFRWFKSTGHFGHLISHCREGVLTHLYVAIIGITLMYLHSGLRPSKYLFAMLSVVSSGSATLDDILPILRERERRCELDRQSRARRVAKKKI